jgi:hypothetical protein
MRAPANIADLHRRSGGKRCQAAVAHSYDGGTVHCPHYAAPGEAMCATHKIEGDQRAAAALAAIHSNKSN